MSDLDFEPQDDSKRETLIVTIAVRIGLTLLLSFLSFLVIVLAHPLTVYLFGEPEAFKDHTSAYFLFSLILCIIIGVFTPFSSLKKSFVTIIGSPETTKFAPYQRIIIFLVVFLVFIVIYWYFLTLAVMIIFSLADLF